MIILFEISPSKIEIEFTSPLSYLQYNNFSQCKFTNILTEDSITKERAFVLRKLINLSREGRFDFVTVKDGGKIVVRMLENDAGVKDFVHIERLDQIDRLGIDEREFVPILEEAFGLSKSSGEGEGGRRDPQ